jgi:DNA-binding GntR family transcriptional regulator
VGRAKPEPRRIRYQEIADELRARVRRSPGGTVLPSEAELSAEFDASRVTIRRALELVRDEGLIDARQGFGWFVSSEPVRQHLETLGTIEAQLEDSGRHAERRVEEFAFASAPERVAAVLGVTDVLRVKRVNLADGEPFAVVTVWCPRSHARRRAPARRARRLTGAAVRARHHRRARQSSAHERAPLPCAPHRVRGRPPAGRAVAHPVGLAPRGVTTRGRIGQIGPGSTGSQPEWAGLPLAMPLFPSHS